VKGRLKSGSWRSRLVRHHAPIVLASAAVFVAFMTLPSFDADAYPHADIVSAAVPRARSGVPTDMAATPTASGATATTTASPGTHGRDPTPATDHGSAQTAPVAGHGGGQAPSHSPGQTAAPIGHGDPVTLSLPSSRDLTVGTGYVALGLLALTLLIGPANLLRGKRHPVSSYLRRDVGLWTAVVSVAHVFVGLQVHGRIADFINYFIDSNGRPWLNSFGLGNWTGLAATVIVVGLLVLSSDAALRTLKARPWKQLQRLNYALFALVIAHAFFYGALVRSTSPYTTLLALAVMAVFLGQAIGFWTWRHRFSGAAPAV
jgi:methionine sulfoxide reductase heme-binding subunit